MALRRPDGGSANLPWTVIAVHPVVLLPLVGFLALSYIGIKVTERTCGRFVAWVVVLVLLAYIWLKQYTFLPSTIFLRFPYLTLGISYIVFCVLHLVIDSGSELERPRLSVFAYVLYALNFTTFVSGPIQRYEDFARDQFASERAPLGMRIVGLQLERIIRGLFKVNVLGMILQIIQQDALTQLTQPVAMNAKLSAGFQLALVYPLFFVRISQAIST